jgi:hypothetical protein
MYPHYKLEGYYVDSNTKKHIILPETLIRITQNEIVAGILHEPDNNKITCVKGYFKHGETHTNIRGLLVLLEKNYNSISEALRDTEFATKTAWILNAFSQAAPSGGYIGRRMELENEVNFSYNCNEFVRNIFDAAQVVTKFPAEVTMRQRNNYRKVI